MIWIGRANKNRLQVILTSLFSDFRAKSMFTVAKYAKGNKLTAQAETNARRTVAFINDVLESIPNHLRIVETVRTPQQNAVVKAPENSKHLTTFAAAVDFAPIGKRAKDDLPEQLQAVCDRHQFAMKVFNVRSRQKYHCEF